MSSRPVGWRWRWRTAALLLVPLLFAAAPALSQSFYGSLVSVVRDSSGDVVPGASLTLVNTGTNETRTGVSGGDGTYQFVNLVPGTYRLEVELPGFQRYVRDGIEVNVQATPRIEAVLELGGLSETVEVTSEAPLLQTESAALGAIVSSRSVQTLPLDGRNVMNLITMAPSVVPQGGTEGSLTGKNVFAGGNYQIGGGTANQSATLFDGVSVQDPAYGNIVVLTPSPDAVAEFRVQTNASSAEFGRFTGGVINMASRSGTNAFHGNLFEYYRNRELNSNTYFGERAGLDKPPFSQHNFGGALSGPIARDKAFFFANYERYRNREGILFQRTVPTLAMRNGDFSDFRNLQTGQVVPIYDPWTQCGTVNPGTGVYNGDCGTVPARLQFPGNIIPQDRINPISRALLNFPIYAEPTEAGPWKTQNFVRNAQVGGDNSQINLRMDYNVNQNQRLIGRITRFESTNLPVDVYGNGQRNGDPYSPEHFITTQVMIANTQTINPSTVFDMRFGFLRWDYDRTPGNLGINLVDRFGFPVTPYGEISQRSGIPGMETIPSIGAGSNQVINTGLLLADDKSYEFTPTLTKLAGGHTLKIGANLMFATGNYFQNNSPGGTIQFSAAPTALNGTNPGATGDGFASFLLGIPTGGTYQSSGFTNNGTSYQAYFIDDTWRVNSKLTLTPGIRFERPGVYTEKDDLLVSFNPDAVNPVLQGLTNPETGQPYLGAFELVNSEQVSSRGLRNNVSVWAPRFGFAYQLGPNTVLRGGTGKFITPSTVRFTDGVNGPLVQLTQNIVTSLDENQTFFTDLSNPFPSGVRNFPGRDPVYQQDLLGGGASHFYRDEEGYPGYTYQWNAVIQHQFRNNLSVEAGYTGLDGNHLPSARQINQLPFEYVQRAANDTTVCSLTGNQIIPQGDPGFVAGQADTCYGAYLRQNVPNPFYGIITAGPLSTPTIQRARLLMPHPHYNSASRQGYEGESRYHALQLRADKRFSAGASVSANYTFSKNESNVESTTTWLESGAGTPSAGYQTNDLRSEFSLSSFDVRHRFVLNYTIDLPFGAGRRFMGDASGLAEALLGGWSVHGVVTLQSGFPLGFGANPNLIGNGYGLRPNVDPNCDKTVSGSAEDRLNQWFNTACFSVPNAASNTDPRLRWQLGNAPRTDPDLRGHGVNNWNLAVSKTTPLQGGMSLTLRAEAFNLFNRVQFGMPNTTVSTSATSTFGMVTSQRNQPRLVQLAARLTF
jgi:hypothetical protein